jgi:hypothetical protein
MIAAKRGFAALGARTSTSLHNALVGAAKDRSLPSGASRTAHNAARVRLAERALGLVGAVPDRILALGHSASVLVAESGGVDAQISATPEETCVGWAVRTVAAHAQALAELNLAGRLGLAAVLGAEPRTGLVCEGEAAAVVLASRHLGDEVASFESKRLAATGWSCW